MTSSPVDSPNGPRGRAPVLDPTEVETPAAVVDLDVARQNARKVVDYGAGHGLAWRPHVKTHKSRTLARIQLEAGARGLTVATLHEAEVMARVCDDLLLAYPQVGEAKLRRLGALLETGVDLKVALDSFEALEGAARAGQAAGRDVGIVVELDVGMGRVGVPGPEAVVELASRSAETRGTSFRGILFYPGHIRAPAQEQGPMLAEVGARLGEAIQALEGAGLPPGMVSGGSTPTLWRSHEIPGMTEIRAGTVIFNDRDMLALGICEPDEVAFHILATVVSVAVPGHAVVDAGSKALAKEELRGDLGGYGLVPDHPEVRVASLSEEHGVLDISGSDWTPRVGDRVRILPNHVCVCVNLQDRLLARRDGGYEAVLLEGRGRGPGGAVPL
jgi:D-serine deaminase-like pyridoxal phosphate-dependent protein